MSRTLSWSLPLIVFLGVACDGMPGTSSEQPLTAISGAPHTIEFDAYVYVPVGANDDHIRWAIRNQVKSSLGALKELDIGIEDRHAETAVDAATWHRSTWTVIDNGAASGAVERIAYHYRDTAIVGDGTHGPIALHLLVGDYVAGAAALRGPCADDPDAAADSLWYHFTPGRWSCQQVISAEADAIAEAMAQLDSPSSQVPTAEVQRRFLSVTASLAAHDSPPALHPEYDRLWTEGPDDTLVAYSFFGVDSDISNPGDHGIREYMRHQRTLRQRFPMLRVVYTRPAVGLLDYYVDGALIAGVTFDDVERWILDNAGYPAAVGSSARLRDALRRQVVERFAERWVYWQLPMQVDIAGTTHNKMFELRAFYGEEDGSHEAFQRARDRYLEAFWHGNIFAYTGHSHFGHGPLNPDGYSMANFASRYQVMLVNSCLSFNYYDRDFLAMHPGGSADLDMVVNAMPAYWRGMGQAAASYIISLVDGEQKDWRQLLNSMRVNLPWEHGYDPLRVVNGELDNVYSPDETPLSVTPAVPTHDWQRTVILIEGATEPGQDMFVRGGIDHSYAKDHLGRDCDADNLACAIPIRHLNHRNATTRDWKQGDHHLDWYGTESRQSGASVGTPADWTIDTWPAGWGTKRTVARDGFGETSLNIFGAHYWMIEVDMACDATAAGWFELKSYISNGPGWEVDVSQPDAPYVSNNHFGRCGKLNVFRRGQDEATIGDVP